jgi:hypothetical protein
MVTAVGWHWIGPRFQWFFFDLTLVGVMAGACCVLMVVASYLIRLKRMLRS